MTYTEYIEYWRDIAVHLKEIAHTEEAKRFARINIDEVATGIRTAMDFTSPCMTLECYEKNINDLYSDNLRDVKAGAIMILKFALKDDFDQQDAVLNETEQITHKIISKLRKDYKLFQGPKRIKLGEFSMYKVGPLWDSCFGWRMEFTFDDSLNSKVVYNANDWTY